MYLCEIFWNWIAFSTVLRLVWTTFMIYVLPILQSHFLTQLVTPLWLTMYVPWLKICKMVKITLFCSLSRTEALQVKIIFVCFVFILLSKRNYRESSKYAHFGSWEYSHEKWNIAQKELKGSCINRTSITWVRISRKPSVFPWSSKKLNFSWTFWKFA